MQRDADQSVFGTDGAGHSIVMDHDEQAKQIAAWADSPAEHAQAAETLAGWGDRAVPGLRDYLRRGPQVIPQPRCFAVAMLARLPTDAATACLREVLHSHPLKSLSPSFAESEYVVKSGALDALCARPHAALAEDIAFGLRERLRTAVVAAGRTRLPRFADALVDVLDDDVLAENAMTALAMVGDAAGVALWPRLDAWLIEAHDNARRRLALVRALRVLHHLHAPADAAVGNALRDPHAAVRAAAALLLGSEQRHADVIEALLHGAVGFDRGLADDCRLALASAGREACAPVEQALQRNAEPDLYGETRPLSPESRDWLVGNLWRCRGTYP